MKSTDAQDVMSNKFDELAKGLAQSVTPRGALKRFGIGIAGFALAAAGLTNKTEAGQAGKGYCAVVNGVQTGFCLHTARKVKVICPRGSGNCFIDVCDETGSADCIAGLPASSTSDEAHCQMQYSNVACR